MSLKPGDRLGQHEIVSALGAGGMGEVYRARDTQLGREVAIKVLLDEVSSDPERLARFEREAKLLASLNHSNIATLYGFEKAGSTHFLVMELVEGETLAERIARGPLPVDEAIPLFVRIARGLEAAHERGVVHRDLKPANIKISEEGDPKILDFGLAKALSTAEALSGDPSLSASPTLTLAATQRGEVLGTAAYMSPEQAKGKAIDRRTDVWAFGACLFEALAGRRAFRGKDASELLGSVLMMDPEWEALPRTTPRLLERLLRRCLVKDARDRLHDIGDARLDLLEAGEEEGAEIVVPSGGGWRRRLEGAIVGAVVVAVLAIAFREASSEPAYSGEALVSLSLTVPEGSSVALPFDHPISVARNAVTIAPDGSEIVYTGVREGERWLIRRRLGSFDSRVIPGTRGAMRPAYSPDGTEVAFLTDENLMRVRLSGADPEIVTRAPNSYGFVWGVDGTIYFGHDEGANSRIDPSGSSRERLPEDLGTPFPLPDGAGFLSTVWQSASRDNSLNSIVYMTAELEWRPLGILGFSPRYVSSGHLVFHRGSAVYAAPFDPTEGELTGSVVQVLDGVWCDSIFGSVYMDVAANGTLVYLPGENFALSVPTWLGRDGTREPLPVEPAVRNALSLSPDGSELAIQVIDLADQIHVYDFERGALTQLTFGEGSGFPLWSAEGQRVIFTNLGQLEERTIASRSILGSRAPERLIGNSDLPDQPNSAFLMAYSGTADGRYLAIATQHPVRNGDLWRIDLTGEEPPRLLVPDSEHHEIFPALSPDGELLAYTSNKTGRFEIFVRTLGDEEAEEVQVSSESGEEPLWSASGDEIFYRNGKYLMSAGVSREPELSADSPEVAVVADFHNSAGVSYAVSGDGQRFLVNSPVEAGRVATELRVVVNWFEELKRLAPVD